MLSPATRAQLRQQSYARASDLLGRVARLCGRAGIACELAVTDEAAAVFYTLARVHAERSYDARSRATHGYL